LCCCSDKVQQTTQASVKSKPTKEAKPGAPITLGSSSLVLMDVNQSTDIEIVLNAQPSDGELQIELVPTQGLELRNTQSQQKLSLNHAKKIPVTLFASTNGRYYLNLHLSLNDQDSRSSRNLAVIVQVGPVVEESIKFKKTSGENVISLPAKETISN
jgi:hypothetical protein